MQKKTIITDQSNLELFFLNEINKHPHQIDSAWMLNPYFAKLLAYYALSEKYWVINDNKVSTPFLYVLYDKAINSESNSEKHNNFKILGDIAVYNLIVFNKVLLTNKNQSYYRDMGIMAYQQVYNLTDSIVFNLLSNNLIYNTNHLSLVFNNIKNN